MRLKYKSQGQTLNQAVIDLGSKETYVALSRLRHIKDFLIKPFPYDRIEKIKNSSALNARITEECRLRVLGKDKAKSQNHEKSHLPFKNYYKCFNKRF